MAKHSIQITDSKLYESIVEYCKENGLKVSFLCTDMLRKQFLIEKFGDIPFGNFQDSSVSYDDKSVTSSVVGPLNTSGDAIVLEEENNNVIVSPPLTKETEGKYSPINNRFC